MVFQIWPGVEKLPDYKEKFPKWQRNEKAIVSSMKPLSPEGQDLAQVDFDLFPHFFSRKCFPTCRVLESQPKLPWDICI